ncbi:MAG: CvpA family protein [Pseudomonadales bacterium]|nr:CvpA family protein [Pseudomonadales bacterium]
MTGWHYADIAISVVILVSAAIGMARGLMRTTVALAIWLAAFLIASMFAESAMNLVQLEWMEGLSEPAQQTFRYSGAFAAIFIGVIVVGAILQWILGKLVQGSGLTGTDRTLGFFFGGALGAILVIVVLVLVESSQAETDWWQESLIRPYLMAFESDVVRLLGLIWEALRG